MRVKDCMSKNIVYATNNSNIRDVAKLMSEHHIGVVPMCDNEQKILGIITDRDIILRSIANDSDKDIKRMPATEIMTTDVIRTSRDTEISWAAEIMARNQIRRLPVVENEKLVGMLSVGDLSRSDDVPNNEVASCINSICNCSGKNAY